MIFVFLAFVHICSCLIQRALPTVFIKAVDPSVISGEISSAILWINKPCVESRIEDAVVKVTVVTFRYLCSVWLEGPVLGACQCTCR